MASLSQRHTLDIAAVPVSVRLLFVASILALSAATTACSSMLPPASSTSSSTQQSSAHIVLSPTNASVTSGGKLQLTALIQNSDNAGVRWSASAGAISSEGLFNAPTVNTAQTVVVRADHLASLESATASISVTPTESLIISTQELPAATSGVSYSVALSGVGGTAPYSWSISSGALPLGMRLDASNGVVSGSSNQTGTFQFTVSARDVSFNQATQGLSLTVSGFLAGRCGPPTYGCAASTSPRAVVQLPEKLPTWTASNGPNAGNPLYGAGVSVTTHEFGSPTTIFRLTDLTNNCNPNASSFYSSGQVTNSGSGDETHFNANSTLVVLGSSGGWICPEAVTIVRRSLSFSRIDNDFSFPSTTNSVIPSYDSGTPTVMYALNNTQIHNYDFTGYGPTVTAPSPTTEYDFASRNCLLHTANPYRMTWADHMSSAKYPPDSMFGTAFSNAGEQNTGFDVVAYKPGFGCSHFNTKTGVISGDWGSTGAIDIPDRFTVHNAVLSKDGAWMVIAWGTCLTSCSAANNSIQYFWQVGTTNVLLSCSSADGGKCGGHFTEGSEKFVNVSGASIYQEETRPFAGAPSIPTGLKAGISSCFGPVWEIHQGWPNVDLSDSNPYMETSISKETGLTGSPFTCPFLNEVDLVSPASVGSSAPDAGTVYREAHTFNSNQQTTLFSCQNAIGSISTDGQIAIWESDGLGAFGSTSGRSTCSATTCRCEVLGMLLQ